MKIMSLSKILSLVLNSGIELSLVAMASLVKGELARSVGEELEGI
jgi:hypothetical protein